MADNIKSEFPIFEKYNNLAYLDNAATTQRPAIVIDTITDFYTFENANIHRGIYDLSNNATKMYEEVRQKVANFINAKSIENIGFTKGTTESINVIANSYLKPIIKSDQNIVTTIMEHHANFLPWQNLCEQLGCELRIAKVDEKGNLDIDHLYSLMDEKTALLSVVHISNTLGTINPIKHIIEKAHSLEIPVMIDAAQSAALYDLNAQQLKYDFLAFSGHKLFGPFGIGILYAGDNVRDKIGNYNVGGGMIQHVSVEKTSYRPFPYNLEAGTTNISAVVGLGAAIDFLSSINRSEHRKRIDEITEYGYQKLSEIDKVKLLSYPDERSGILSFNIEDIHPHDIASFLNKDEIAVRAGMHCTQPLLEEMGMPATVRASFTIYNDKSEIDRLANSIQELIDFWS